MVSMEIVALHLQKEAIKNGKPPDECDLFGRSAYNRYYYASFLRIRSMLIELDRKWDKLGHRDYPDILRGKIKSQLDKFKRNAQKTRDKELIQLCLQAIHATHELAMLMEKGFATRVVADYFPEVKVDFITGDRFKLQNIEITEAHQWPDKADTLADTIISAWRQGHE
jgi:hypothetical protein